MNVKEIVNVVKATVGEWTADKATWLAAALAYYTVFSVAPLLVVVIGVAGLVLGEEAAQQELTGRLQDVMSPAAAQTLQDLVANARESGQTATVIGTISSIVIATGLFSALHSSLNMVWGVEPKPGKGLSGIVNMVLTRALGFLMILGIGVLLILSLFASAALSVLQSAFQDALPFGSGFVWQTVNFVVSVIVLTVLFAIVYKVLPDAKIEWSDVWVGAIVTAVLFKLGELAISIYLGRSSYGSTFGAASSLVLLLVWVYYSALIFFFGAEFTQVYARRYGKQIEPAGNARRVPKASALRKQVEREQETAESTP